MRAHCTPHLVLVLLVVVVAAWQAGTGARARQVARVVTIPEHDVEVGGMDRSVTPGDDFFAYANGRWLRAAQIPPDKSTAGIWSDLVEDAAQRTRGVIEQLPQANPPAGSDERRIADYYLTYMDEGAIEAAGIAPLNPLLEPIRAIDDRRSLSEWICGSLRADVDPLNMTDLHTDRLFGLWFSQDLNDPTRNTPYLLQGGLGMPDREYYLDSSPEMERIRTQYRAHIAAMLELAAVGDAEATADGILALERQIASVHWTRTESSQVTKANNPWTPDGFSRRAPGIDWPACFRTAGLEGASSIIVWQPSAVIGIAALVGREPVDTWRNYLLFHLIDRYAPVLPRSFVDQRFAFYGKVLSGTPQLRDRWKRAVDATNAALGDAVGRLYVGRYFAPEAKAHLSSVVRNIISAFDRRIERLTWMKPSTKAGAKAKLGTLIVGIGYPDTWRDYGGLEVVPGEPLMNVWRAELFRYRSERAKLGRRVDRSEWWILPQTVNALNLPAQNALNFPAAILRPPFYDPAADAPVVYGAIGAVIGHEISHSFDDQGSQFDAAGKLSNWWTEEDFAHFKAASAALVAQYNEYSPLPELHVNGELTLGENIADLAGLSAAYDAYRASGRGSGRSLTGFSDDQRFFISFAQTWRTKMREALVRQVLIADAHAPDQFRADTVRNLDAWYTAFEVRSSQRLFLAPSQRVRIW
jgi:putative endopeptidase